MHPSLMSGLNLEQITVLNEYIRNVRVNTNIPREILYHKSWYKNHLNELDLCTVSLIEIRDGVNANAKLKQLLKMNISVFQLASALRTGRIPLHTLSMTLTLNVVLNPFNPFFTPFPFGC